MPSASPPALASPRARQLGCPRFRRGFFAARDGPLTTTESEIPSLGLVFAFWRKAPDSFKESPASSRAFESPLSSGCYYGAAKLKLTGRLRR